MKTHWSEKLFCQCGKTFRSMSAEAIHRHNFPALCKGSSPMKTHRVKMSAEGISRHIFKKTDRHGDAYLTPRYYMVKWDGTKSFQAVAQNYIERISDEG